MSAIRHFLPWVAVLVLVGLLVSLLPGTTKWSIVITQIPLLPVTGLVVYRYLRPEYLSEKAVKVTIALVALADDSLATLLLRSPATTAGPAARTSR